MRRLHQARIRNQIVLALVAAGFSLSGIPATAEPQRSQETQPQLPRFATEGPAIDLDVLKGWISRKFRSTGRFMVDRKQLPIAVKNRGLTFEADDQTIRDLESVGATPELLAVIREVGPVRAVVVPPPAKAQPKPVTGTLTVRCVPAECAVGIDLNRPEETKGGVLRKDLEVGKHSIAVTRAGFNVEEKSLPLTTAGAELTFTLKPNPDTMARFGTELMKQMLGTQEADAGQLFARGAWTRTSKQGSEERNFAMLWGPKQSVMMVASQPGWYQLSCQGETCLQQNDRVKEFASIRQGKELKGDEGRRVEQELRAFRKALPSYVLNEIRSAFESFRLRPSAESTTADSAGQYKVVLQGGDETYVLRLNSAYQVMEITHTLGTATATTTYGQYEDLGSGKFPKLIRTSAAGDKETVLQVRLDTLAPAAR